MVWAGTTSTVIFTFMVPCIINHKSEWKPTRCTSVLKS
jgi:hypothetical protein